MATIIDRETILNADISSDLIVLTYFEFSEAGGGKSRFILPRIELGFENPIVGDGQYQFSAQIQGGDVTPRSIITVLADQTTAVLQGRHLAIEPGDTVTITVRGLPADTSVSVVTALFDATPIQQEDLDVILVEIADQISNLNIVAVKERVILGSCVQPQNGTAQQSALPQTAGQTPQRIARQVVTPPQVIPREPVVLDDC